MSRASKAPQPAPEDKRNWIEKRPAEPAPGTLTPLHEQDDAIGMFLGESADPIRRSPVRDGLKKLRWALVLLPVIAIVIPVSLWMQHQSQYVTSKNAAVRGHVAEIGTRLNGLVESVEVDVGDRVVAGQVLARLQSRHLEAEVQETRADVEGLERAIEIERSNIELRRRETTQQDTEADARVNAAKAQADAARIEVEDRKRAFELRESLFLRDGAVSNEEVKRAESAYRTAQAKLQEAEANLVAARSSRAKIGLDGDGLDIREQGIGVLESNLERARARLERAEADLEGTVIRAPEDGAIVRRVVQPGGSVDVGQPILSMWLGREVWVEAWIEEEDIAHVTAGAKVTVTFHSYPGREFEGVVDKIGLSTDLELPDTDVPQPRSQRMRNAPVVGVRVRLLDTPENLVPGLSAVVSIDRQR